jgi:ribosomal-protein-alanine N-acetyltransferase
MFDLLSNSKLYAFIPQNPPALQELAVRYKKWESRKSPDGQELWLNWIARLKNGGPCVGHFQAGFKRNEASVATLLSTLMFRRRSTKDMLHSIAAFKIRRCTEFIG